MLELLRVIEECGRDSNYFLNIDSAVYRNECLELEVNLFPGNDDSPNQNWKLNFTGVAANQVGVHSWQTPLSVHDKHPLLIRDHSATGELYIKGVPESAADVMLKIFNRHRDLVGDWIPPFTVLNGPLRVEGVLANGSGQFANGPLRLIYAYEEVLKAESITTSIISHFPDEEDRGDFLFTYARNCQVFFIGRSYIIAQSCEAIRI